MTTKIENQGINHRLISIIEDAVCNGRPYKHTFYRIEKNILSVWKKVSEANSLKYLRKKYKKLEGQKFN